MSSSRHSQPTRTHSFRRLSLAFVGGIAFVIAGAALFVAVGGVDVAQTIKPGFLDRTLAPWALDRSIQARTGHEQNPITASKAALETGREHYANNCVTCHGAPGIHAAELAKGLTPSPPPLDGSMTQSSSDAELFWIVKNGVRFTAKPGFGPTHSDAEVWKLILFVRHLPELSEEDCAALRLPDKTGARASQP